MDLDQNSRYKALTLSRRGKTSPYIMVTKIMASSRSVVSDYSIAVLIPCYNEEGAIGKVIREFQEALPSADIYVFDNNSNDKSREEALANGAIVRREPRQGKGHVVRRMFADIEADIYVMVDGDDTYEAAAAPNLVQLLIDENLDMVNGARETEIQAAFRAGHRFGNRVLTGLVRQFFGKHFTDMLSGYRVFSRRFVKSFPMDSRGFEIETELTVHSLELEMPTSELRTAYKDRPDGTKSKLRTYSDGTKILWTILKLLKRERPMQTFFVVGSVLIVAAVAIAYPVFADYIETGRVPRIPTAVLSSAMVVLGFLSFTCGMILDTVTKGRQEAKRMRYLGIPSVRAKLYPSSTLRE